MNHSMNFPLPLIITSENNGVEGEGQCDCACPSPSISPSYDRKALGATTQLIKNSLAQTISLDSDLQTLFTPSSDSIAVVNKSTIELIDAFENPLAYADLPVYWQEAWGGKLFQSVDRLASLGFLLHPETVFLPVPPDNPDKLIAWLHVTNECNLRCHYCYIQKTEETMDINTGRAAIEAIYRSASVHGFTTVKLKYAGGEPTLNFPLIISLQEYASQLAEQNNLKLDGVVLSNGVGITPQLIDNMLTHNLRLMISLDGIGMAHDSQRVFSNGVGSFKIVNNTVNRALTKGLIPDISITVTERNADALPETIAWMLDQNLPFSINFYRENDISVAFDDLQLGEERIIRGMQAAFKVIEANLPSRSLLPSLIDRANLAVTHSHTCGVGSNYMVIDHHGRISKCQMQIKKPVTTVAAQDPLSFIRADQIGIQNLHVDEKEGCRDCEWRYWCAGGCPLATHRATGRYDIKSPNCNIYKTLYPEAVRLEGLRLLKYAK